MWKQITYTMIKILFTWPKLAPFSVFYRKESHRQTIALKPKQNWTPRKKFDRFQGPHSNCPQKKTSSQSFYLIEVFSNFQGTNVQDGAKEFSF